MGIMRKTTAKIFLIGCLPVYSIVLPNGHISCPCLSSEALSSIGRKGADVEGVLGESKNLTAYGLGCDVHDVGTLSCTPAASDEDCKTMIPKPKSCNSGWCEKEWCFVDGTTCSIAHDQSHYFSSSNIHYSYATCSNVDRFATDARINLLGNKTFRVGFTSNSGGWKGAYSAEGSFSLTGWSGPTIDFFEKAALEANFNMKASTFPEHLREESVAFFSTSSFDRCVYTTSIGYLDFCVERYTITNKRASAATFFTLFSKPLYLVVFMEEKGSMTAF